MKTVGLVFSDPITSSDPLKRTDKKRPVYEELLERCKAKGWEVVIVSRKGYLGDGDFEWHWEVKDGKMQKEEKEIKVDLVYDRSGGLQFPVGGDNLIVVNNRNFKLLAWDKWLQYQEIGRFMPKTVLVDFQNISGTLEQLQTKWIVIKPTNGLKGLGIFIGPKDAAFDFQFSTNTKYIAQEFIETKNGIPGIANRRHDLRVVIINGKPVWSHVRIPPEDEYKANMSGREGGSLKEVLVANLPESVIKIVKEIAPKFTKKYDSPIYSLDFGFDEKGKPWVFEINDQIGFPTLKMKAKNLFLEELVKNFEEKM